MGNKRSMLQWRRSEPRGGSRDPYYVPERDLAHVGPAMVKGAMHAMEEPSWEPWLREFLDRHGITYQSILDSQAPLLLAQALNRVIALDHPPAAMKAVGFDQLPPEIQLLFYARLGQVFLGAVWAGVKDVSRPDSDPPASFQEILDYAATAYSGFEDGTESRPAGDGTTEFEDVGEILADDPDPR